MSINKIIIASAGSGKTTFLINQAIKNSDKKILITTYTEANESEIKKKIVSINKFIPENITIQTWFSFLLQHGVRPYQGVLYPNKINGLLLVNSASGLKYKTGRFPVFYKEEHELEKHYFSKGKKIYSDKLSKFVFRCQQKSKGEVIQRLERIYDSIFIDEVQDLAGYDLEFVRLLAKSTLEILLVGDPRQVTYLTHIEKKFKKYRNGKIKDFIENECKKIEFQIDETSLNKSFRCKKEICEYASTLYPDFPKPKSKQLEITHHVGIFLVKKNDVENYLKKYSPIQLRLNSKIKVDENYAVHNFGASKGLTFDRVLIYPTLDMIRWMKNVNHNLKDQTRAKFYVGITRAKFSVGIVCDEVISNDFIKEYSSNKFSLQKNKLLPSTFNRKSYNHIDSSFLGGTTPHKT